MLALSVSLSLSLRNALNSSRIAESVAVDFSGVRQGYAAAASRHIVCVRAADRLSAHSRVGKLAQCLSLFVRFSVRYYLQLPILFLKSNSSLKQIDDVFQALVLLKGLFIYPALSYPSLSFSHLSLAAPRPQTNFREALEWL